MIDNIGLPYSSINYTYSTSAPIGPEDADIMISLTEKHRPTQEFYHSTICVLKLNKSLSRCATLLLPSGPTLSARF